MVLRLAACWLLAVDVGAPRLRVAVVMAADVALVLSPAAGWCIGVATGTPSGLLPVAGCILPILSKPIGGNAEAGRRLSSDTAKLGFLQAKPRIA